MSWFDSLTIFLTKIVGKFYTHRLAWKFSLYWLKISHRLPWKMCKGSSKINRTWVLDPGWHDSESKLYNKQLIHNLVLMFECLPAPIFSCTNSSINILFQNSAKCKQTKIFKWRGRSWLCSGFWFWLRL